MFYECVHWFSGSPEEWFTDEFKSLVCVSWLPPSGDGGLWAQSALPDCETWAGRGPYGNHDSTGWAGSMLPTGHKQTTTHQSDSTFMSYFITSRGCTWMMLVPFLKLVKERMTSWLKASTDCFQVLEKPRTSCVIRATHTHTHTCRRSLNQHADTRPLYCSPGLVKNTARALILCNIVTIKKNGFLLVVVFLFVFLWSKLNF